MNVCVNFSSAISATSKSTTGSLRFSSEEGVLRYVIITDVNLTVNYKVLCLLFSSLQNEKWMNIRVGDIIKLENNQFVAVSTLHDYMPQINALLYIFI